MSIIEDKHKTMIEDILIVEKDCGGELYDLTASSVMYDNKEFNTGELKFNHALKHGISETIEKFIDEIEIMKQDELDDKTQKRIDKQEILKYLLFIDKELKKFKKGDLLYETSLAKFFAITTNYLCGGNGIDQFENQPLIVTVAGGNPLKIFFGLITYIKDADVDEFIDMYFSEIENLPADATDEEKKIASDAKKNIKEIVKNIHNCLNAKLLARGTSEFKFHIDTLHSKIENMFIDDEVNNIANYSDMDFAITPNKEEILIEYFKITSSKEAISTHSGGGPTDTVEIEVPKIEVPKIEKESARTRVQPGRKAKDKPPEEKETQTVAYQQYTDKLNAQKNAQKRKADRLEAQKLEAQEKAQEKRKKTETRKRNKSPAPASSSKAQKTKKQSPSAPPPKEDKPENEGFLLVRLKTQNIYKRNSGETGDPFEGVKEPYKSLLNEMNKYKQKTKRDKEKVEIPFCNKDDRLKLNQSSYLKLLQPNLFRKSYLKLAEEEPCRLSEDCQKFMKFLNASKELTGKLSENNTKTFIAGLDSNSFHNNKNNLANFMKFIHISTKKQNETIEKLFNNKEKLTYDATGKRNQEVLPKYKNIKDVKDNFETIENISNPKRPLFKLMCELVLEFSKRDKVKEFLEKISEQFKGPHKKETNYGTYVNIPNKNSYILDQGNYSLKYSNDKGELPAHSKITTNLTIKPGIIKSEKSEKSEDDLKKELENILDYENSRDDVYEEKQNLNEIIEGMNKLTIHSAKGRRKRTKRTKRTKRRKIIKRTKKKKRKSMRKKNTKKNNKR